MIEDTHLDNEAQRLLGRKLCLDGNAHWVCAATNRRASSMAILDELGVFPPGGTKSWIDHPINLFKINSSLHREFDISHSFAIGLAAESCAVVLEALQAVDNTIRQDWEASGGRKMSTRCLAPYSENELKNRGWTVHGLQYEIMVLRPDVFGFLDENVSKRCIELYRRGARSPQKFYTTDGGDLLDEHGHLYEPFFHQHYRPRSFEIHPIAVLLNFLNKVTWYEKEYGGLSALSPRNRHLIEMAEKVTVKLFSPPSFNIPISSPSDASTPLSTCQTSNRPDRYCDGDMGSIGHVDDFLDRARDGDTTHVASHWYPPGQTATRTSKPPVCGGTSEPQPHGRAEEPDFDSFAPYLFSASTPWKNKAAFLLDTLFRDSEPIIPLPPRLPPPPPSLYDLLPELSLEQDPPAAPNLLRRSNTAGYDRGSQLRGS
ncbi:hypothetical protein JCM11251_001751 [Rhodosporidiobolus azoricus]